ncbi:MAG: TonB-dependent receptor [Cyclobacteriaceae bacterium]
MKYTLFQTILMVAKHTLYVFVLFAVTVSSAISATVNAQIKSVKEVFIEIDKTEISVDELFSAIEKNSEFRFFYTDEGLDTNTSIMLKSSEGSVADFLISVASQTKAEFRQVNNTISVKKGLVKKQVEIPVEINVTRTITGKITDEKGEALPGATVVVKGTTVGTITDFDGMYSLDAPEGAVLEITFIGYTPTTVEVGDRSVINVSLAQDIDQLEEVVVVGYGTSKVKDLTGSVSRVGEEDFVKGINVSPDQLIQGKVAGVNIVNNSGQPGGGVTFRIRGTSSVRTGNQPLFVVDGVPLDGRNTKPGATAGEIGTSPASNPLSFLNPNDIATMDILKDASATAIYGSRGSNGVVIITTKKGTTGKPKVNVNATTGVSMISKTPDVMDGDTFRRALDHRELDNYDGASSSDAFDEITRTAITKTANFSLSGGNESGNYRVSAGVHDQEGIILGSGIERYTGSFKGQFKLLPEDRVKLDVGLNASVTNEKGAPIAENSNVNGSLIGNAIEWNPTVPLKDANGDFIQQSYDNNGNVVAGLPTNPLALIAYYHDNSIVTNVLANIGATVRIIDGLNYKVSYGLNRSVGERNVDISGDLFLNTITGVGFSTIGGRELSSSTLTHTLNYDKKLGNVSVNALLGYEYQTYKNFENAMSGAGFTTFDTRGTDILQNAPQDRISIRSYRDPGNELQSFFGRFFFNVKDKYLVTATMRADGSTKFGENNKYGFFPSFSAAWVLSEESFMSGVTAFDNLKLRVGWGKTGNQEFPAGASQARYAYNQEQLSLVNVANPDLKWESSQTLNLALDFSMFNTRLNGTLEYFDKTTEDLLFLLPTIQPAPSAQYWTNLPASVENTGFEFSLDGVLINQPDLYWNLGVNGTFLTNKLTGYDGVSVLTGQINGNGLGGGSNSQQLANNQPLYSFNMLTFEGFDADGAAQYSDETSFVGDPNPDFLLGINSTLEYKNFGLTMSMNGAFGHELYNNTANAVVTAANLSIGRNTSEEIGLGEESLGNSNVISTRFLEKGDFLRLQNVVLSYTFYDIGFISNLKLFATGQNLFVITDYSGFDPEVNTNRAVSGVPSFGIEYIPYPVARTFTLGLNATF